MSTRTIAEADIIAVKTLNPNWLTDGGHTALITAYINEKMLCRLHQLQQFKVIIPSNVFTSHILRIYILFAFDEFI
jgi:hypothetical protein